MFKLTDAEIDALRKFNGSDGSPLVERRDRLLIGEVCTRLLEKIDKVSTYDDAAHWERVHLAIMAAIITTVLEDASDQQEMLSSFRTMLIYHRTHEPTNNE